MKKPVLYMLVAVLAIAAAAGVALLRPSSPAPDDARLAEEISTEADSPVETAGIAPAPVSLETEKESEATEPSAKEESGPEGIGKVTGKVEIADGSPLPPDLVIKISPYPETATDLPDFERVEWTSEVDAQGAFHFEELPLVRYGLVADSATYTGNSSAYLDGERREIERTITLYPAATITGTVLDEAGTPVAGAKVYASAYVQNGSEVSLGMRRSFSTEADSDDEGRFVVRYLQTRVPPIQYRLLAKAEGYANHLSPAMQPNTQDAVLILSQGSFASGHALHGTTGEPVADLEVGIGSRNQLATTTAKTGADGWFILGPIEPGEHSLSVLREHWFADPATAKFQVAAGVDADGLRVSVMPGGVITGRVYDETTERGIGKARMYVSPAEGGIITDAETDANGEFRFEGLETGAWRVSVDDAPGYPESSGWNRPSIKIALGEEYNGVDFALSRGFTISGIVVDKDGKPVQSAYVNGYAQSNFGGGSQTRDSEQTTTTGQFTLAGFESGQTVQVSAYKSGLASKERENIEIGERSVDGIRLVMVPGASISGTVVDANGRSVSNGEITYTKIAGDGGRHSFMDNFSNGTFELGQLSAGTYEIRPGGYNQRSNDDAVKITVAEGEEKTGVRLVMTAKANMEIAGRVLDESRRPIAGATITTWQSIQQRTRTDDEGRFRVAGLAEGSHSLQVTHDDYTQSNNQVEAGNENMEIVLQRAGIVRGVVVDRGTGRPVQNFELLISTRHGGVSAEEYRNFVRYQSEDGSFELKGVQVGNNTLAARAPDYAIATVDLGAVQPGEERNNIRVPLEAGNVLAGRVVDDTGKGVSGALLFDGDIPRHNEEAASIAKSGSGGNYRIESLPSGSVKLTALHQNYAPTETQVTIRAGVENRTDLVLSSGGGVEGYVTEGGKPIAGAYVNVHMQNPQRSKYEPSDSKGYFQIRGLNAGNVQVSVSQPRVDGSHRNINKTASVSDNMLTRVDLTFPAATATLEGRVTAGNQSVSDARLNAQVTHPDGTSESLSTQGDSNGYYRFAGLPAGEVQVRVWAGSPLAQQKTVHLTLGENEAARRDIDMLSGATLTLRVTNLPAGATQIFAMAVLGNIDLPRELNEAFYQEIGSQMSGQIAIQNGVGTIGGIEPGSYTVIVVARTGEMDPNNPYAGLVATSDTVNVTADGASLDLSF